MDSDIMDSLVAVLQRDMHIGMGAGIGPHSFGRPTFNNKDDNFHFKVAGFSMGSMAPKADAYYEAFSYPTIEHESHISFHSRTARFSFDIAPVSKNETSRLPRPASNPTFPFDIAPPGTRPLKGEIALEDVSTRGISCFRAEQPITVPCLPHRRGSYSVSSSRSPQTGPTNRGWNGRQVSPFSVDSSSSSEYGSPPPKRSRFNSPATSYSPHSESPYGANSMECLNKVTFTITMRRPPRLFVPLSYQSGKKFVVDNSEAGRNKKDITTRQGTASDFVNLIDGAEKRREKDVGPIPVLSEQEIFKVGEYLSYRFTLLMSADEHSKLRKLLGDLGILTKDVLSLQGINEFNASHIHTYGINHGANGTRVDVVPIISIRPEYAQRKKLGTPLPFPGKDLLVTLLPNVLRKLAFPTRFLAEGLISHGIILPFDAISLVLNLNEFIPLDDRARLGKVIGTPAWAYEGPMQHEPQLLRERVLASLFVEDRIKDLGPIIKRRAKALARNGNPPEMPAHLCKVYRCVITPTRILLFPSEQEVSNTILRRHRDQSDRFLRVSFTDEDDRIKMNPIVRTVDAANDSVGTVARVRRALFQGLFISGRHYRFLGHGTSQAREHGCWFVAESPDGPRPLYAEQIRREMGDIKERVVAKYAARLGLAFSTTREVKNAKRGNITFEVAQKTPDVKRGNFTFTDGAGLCSASVARDAARSLGYYSGPDSEPSTIQVRIGGAKGVLTVWPWMVGYQYSLRQSMEKFTSTDKGVNVIRISRFSYAFLNRQFIVLMNELGVPDKVFVDLFNEAVGEVKGMAARIAKGHYNAGDVKRGDELSTFPVRTMVKFGFQRDACLQDLLKVIECRSLTDLRWRARLEIKQGVYLLGIPDELEVLKEGEVFCRYQNPDDPDEEAKIVTGLCIICRAPALHPGDIRRVKAVNRPQLHHLRNVIVFSVKGERDLPNMLGGGDLDGDDYSLIWDPRLIHKYDTPPMSYNAPEPIAVDKVTEEDLKNNFVDYLKNDILGQVDNAHMAWAAHQLHGPRGHNCLELAEIHSKAVDFAKTGVPASMNQGLRPGTWPDFMGKGPHMSYQCDNILGQLYRIINQDPRFDPASEQDIALGVDARLCRLVIPTAFLNHAAEMKQQYDLLLWDVLLRYRITEAEAYSGLVLKNGKRRKMKDHDLKDPVREAFQEIVRGLREEGANRIEKQESSQTLTVTQLLAVACYQVTYDPRYRSLTMDVDEDDEGSEGGDDDVVLLDPDWQSSVTRPRQLISFAWLYGKEILALPIITGHAVEVED